MSVFVALLPWCVMHCLTGSACTDCVPNITLYKYKMCLCIQSGAVSLNRRKMCKDYFKFNFVLDMVAVISFLLRRVYLFTSTVVPPLIGPHLLVNNSVVVREVLFGERKRY